MSAVWRAMAIYFSLLLLFRIAGKRSMKESTPFDLVLLFIIGEATQQGLLGEDYSITNALIIIITLVGLDVGLSLLKHRFDRVEKLIDGVPLIIVENGRPIKERMDKERIDEADIMEKARELQGLERMEQIKYAILESTGTITIIPAQPE